MITPVQLYHIKNIYSGLYVVPNPQDQIDSPLLQEELTNPNLSPLAFQWAFVELGPEKYRILNCLSGLSVTSKDDPPIGNIAMFDYKPGSSLQAWDFKEQETDGSGRIYLTDTLVWDNSHKTTPGIPIRLNTLNMADPSQRWKPLAIAVAAAKGTAG